jgi:hypothetical protein
MTGADGWFRTAILGAAVLWGAGSFGVEVFHAFADSPPPLRAPPSRWTLRAAPAIELEDFLGGLDTELPRDSRVAVGDRGLPASEDFFLSVWVAYDLPHHDVVRARHRPLLDRADYLFLYRSSLEDFREEAIDAVFAERPIRVAEHPAGTLYRIPRK